MSCGAACLLCFSPPGEPPGPEGVLDRAGGAWLSTHLLLVWSTARLWEGPVSMLAYPSVWGAPTMSEVGLLRALWVAVSHREGISQEPSA